MSRNILIKDEIKAFVLELKMKLYNERSNYTTDPKALADKYLNEILDKINQFRY